MSLQLTTNNKKDDHSSKLSMMTPSYDLTNVTIILQNSYHHPHSTLESRYGPSKTTKKVSKGEKTIKCVIFCDVSKTIYQLIKEIFYIDLVFSPFTHRAFYLFMTNLHS